METVTRSLRKQKGVVLLFVVGVLVLGSAALYLATQSRHQAHLSRQTVTIKRLQDAKQALIAYAVNYADTDTGNTGPGHLPCPDTKDINDPNFGTPDNTCSNPPPIGRLPFRWTQNGKSFALHPFATMSDDRFWYALAESFRNNGSGIRLVNPDTYAELTVDSTITDVVSVIIDPGPPLGGQTRPSNNIDDYLEDANAVDDGAFVTSADVPFNDRIAYITRDDLVPLVERRVLGYVKAALQSYYDSDTIPGGPVTPKAFLPFAAALGDTSNACVVDNLAGFLPLDNCALPGVDDQDLTLPAWFTRNNWQQFIYYRVDPSCVSGENCTDLTPALSVNGDIVRAMVISVGRSIVTAPKGGLQDRSGAGGLSDEKVDYLDISESVDGDSIYTVGRRVSDQSNDQVVIISPVN